MLGRKPRLWGGVSTHRVSPFGCATARAKEVWRLERADRHNLDPTHCILGLSSFLFAYQSLDECAELDGCNIAVWLILLAFFVAAYTHTHAKPKVWRKLHADLRCLSCMKQYARDGARVLMRCNPMLIPRPHSPSIFAVSLSCSSATGTKPLKSLAVLLLLYRRKSQGLSRGLSRPGSVHAELHDWIAKAVAEGELRRVGCVERACKRSRGSEQ